MCLTQFIWEVKHIPVASYHVKFDCNTYHCYTTAIAWCEAVVRIS